MGLSHCVIVVGKQPEFCYSFPSDRVLLRGVNWRGTLARIGSAILDVPDLIGSGELCLLIFPSSTDKRTASREMVRLVEQQVTDQQVLTEINRTIPYRNQESIMSLLQVRDLIATGTSILLMGPPGVGKTTAIREVSRLLADEYNKRVVIVDTSNEIGGDGDIPHPGIGRARRMQVPSPESQHQVRLL